MTSDILRASLIHSRITGIYALKEESVNDTIVRADCKHVQKLGFFRAGIKVSRA